MATWDMIVVGSGGGPDETNLSSYLLKPAVALWEDGIIAFEAGSGVGALDAIMRKTPGIFGSRPRSRAGYSASDIFAFVRCYLISHPHLDHVSSLFITAGSVGGQRKRIYASEEALRDLETVFSDRLWPNLANWNQDDDDPHKLLYSPLDADDAYHPLDLPHISVRMMPISHGSNSSTPSYLSSAFFLRHDLADSEILLFGDVEPDSLARTPYNIYIWRAAAPMIPRKLKAIFIECSWPSGRPDALLFGHMTPEHLVEEFKNLAREVVRYRTGSPTVLDKAMKGALSGLRVYIIHCKATFGSGRGNTRPINHVIGEQIRTLTTKAKLGLEVLTADQGMRISV